MIGIIDYKAGNLTSVEYALKNIGADCVVTQDPEVILQADKVVFPGVGSAASCMANFRSFGMDQALKEVIATGKKVLVICIGMQLLFEQSEEDDGVDCLGIFKGKVRHFQFSESEHVKIPHMGWNAVNLVQENHPVYKDFIPGSEFYFVHSYYVQEEDSGIIAANSEYGGKVFTCSVAKDNLLATQFHPEKSGKVGLQLLKNFLDW